MSYDLWLGKQLSKYYKELDEAEKRAEEEYKQLREKAICELHELVVDEFGNEGWKILVNEGIINEEKLDKMMEGM